MNVSEGGEIDHRNGEKAREPGSKGRWEPGGKREGEGQCNGQKVCVLPQIHMLNSNPSVMVFGGKAFGRQLGHQGGALTMRLMPL